MSETPAPMFVEDGPMMVLIGEADNAIPNGTRIKKVVFEEGDSTPLGDEGVVFSSVATPKEMKEEFPDVDFMYWVIWDTMPQVPVAVSSYKIGRADAR